MAKYIDSIKIGSGGFGSVCKCKCDIDGKIYAKKKLLDTADAEEIKRFKREVRILSNLDHPNIIKIIAVSLEKEPYFYIMPLYRGSLADEYPQIIADEYRIKPIFESVLNAIEYSHNQGVIHRDLKPQNILLNSESDVVVSDFGLGRQFNSESTRQTGSGNGLGTPLYMAPEQIDDAKSADERADIYSLGRMLYEIYGGNLLSGTTDFSDIPPAISVIIRRCTNSDPQKRFQSVSDLKIAWLSVFDSAALAALRDDFESLVIQLSSDIDVTEDQAKKFYDGLIHSIDDLDSLQKVMMSVTPKVFSLIERIDVTGLRQVIEKFVNHMTSQSWPFAFTDKIGDCCKRLYYNLEDFESRAQLIYCVTQVGAYHNRWHVMAIAGELLMLPKKAGEAIPINEKLEDIYSARRAVSAYVKTVKLDPLLIPLFKFDD